MGEQDRIKLSTINGKTGYKIKKFQILSQQPGQSNVEFIAKITKTDQTGNITNTVDFTDNDLLAVAYYQDEGNAARQNETIIFDNQKFNQDIFVNITDGASATTRCNYYIELETMPLSDLEATYLTLQNIRDITS